MPIHKKTAFSRRLPDLVTEELAAVLSSRSSYEFKELFEIVHLNLRNRNAASGGEEMLRLRGNTWSSAAWLRRKARQTEHLAQVEGLARFRIHQRRQ